MQFLAESIMLTFTGGIIGILLGILASYIISVVSGSLFVVSPSAILLAFVVSAAIGILFGWYPARRLQTCSRLKLSGMNKVCIVYFF